MEWMMAHPYMTFEVILAAILAIDNVIVNIVKCISAVKAAKVMQPMVKR